MTLIERLEAATGADRELDCLLWLRFGSTKGRWDQGLPLGPTEMVNCRTMTEALAAFPTDASGIARAWNVPALTGSLDAALALVEEKLPGWFWKMGQNPRTPETERYWFEVQCPARDVYREAAAPTPALAVLIALLRALEEKNPK